MFLDRVHLNADVEMLSLYLMQWGSNHTFLHDCVITQRMGRAVGQELKQVGRGHNIVADG